MTICWSTPGLAKAIYARHHPTQDMELSRLSQLHMSLLDCFAAGQSVERLYCSDALSQPRAQC